MLGPNVKKLIFRKMSRDMVPDGLNSVYSATSNIGSHARKATEWVEKAIAAVEVSFNNPYGDDDEAIAEEILRQVENK